MTFLNGRLELKDERGQVILDDAEAFCSSIVQRFELGFHEREDLIQHLVTECWLLSKKFDPDKTINGKPVKFEGWASYKLRCKAIDFRRSPQNGNGRTKWQFRDRTYERLLPNVVSLDERGLDSLESWSGVDTPASSPTDLLRVLANGNSNGSGQAGELGEQADEQAA